MAFAHPGDLLDRFELAADRPAIPFVEVLFRGLHSVAKPETAEDLFDSPGPRRLQVQVSNLFEAHGVMPAFLQRQAVGGRFSRTSAEAIAAASSVVPPAFQPGNITRSLSEPTVVSGLGVSIQMGNSGMDIPTPVIFLLELLTRAAQHW